jgi:hypothetical protein
MSSQHVCLHRAVCVLTALAFGFLFASPTVSAAVSNAPAVRLQIDIPQTSSLTLVVRIPGTTEANPFIDKDVDPWDDDLDGRRPPPPPTPPATFRSDLSSLEEGEGLSDMALVTVDAVSDSVFQLVLRDRDGLAVAATRGRGMGMPLRLTHALAEGRYFLEAESLNGGDAVYVLTLQRSSWP